MCSELGKDASSVYGEYFFCGGVCSILLCSEVFCDYGLGVCLTVLLVCDGSCVFVCFVMYVV